MQQKPLTHKERLRDRLRKDLAVDVAKSILRGDAKDVDHDRRPVVAAMVLAAALRTSSDA